ncbi:hypothetical protein HNR65_002448 [Desulfosalsimonas propionicica]|uniref:Uncharacterized protein n=1 Tax=Desulfosalsimonas propionicica TaxID=332175 RepID=A0A7W0HLB0_9BACT|nr:hypothetical protein [Desulfosalsimonas propionicica]
MKHPIVIATFGSTTRARQIYGHIHTRVKQRFAGHEPASIIWWCSTSLPTCATSAPIRAKPG